jgi:hypothetical protein
MSHHSLSGAAWSVITLGLGQRGVFAPRCPGRRRKCFWIYLHTKLHKSRMFQFIWVYAEQWTPVVRGYAECYHSLSRAPQSVTTRCPGRHRVLPPAVQGDAECYHPLSGAMGSVTTRCLGRHGNSIGQLRVSYKNSKFSTKLKGQIMNMPFYNTIMGPISVRIHFNIWLSSAKKTHSPPSWSAQSDLKLKITLHIMNKNFEKGDTPNHEYPRYDIKPKKWGVKSHACVPFNTCQKAI